MAGVNKQSLREEFAALKGRFAQLSTDGKITAEGRALIQALLMLLQVLMAVFMERHTPKTSTNSSRPSSLTELPHFCGENPDISKCYLVF